jgi:hypothetical protein
MSHTELGNFEAMLGRLVGIFKPYFFPVSSSFSPVLRIRIRIRIRIYMILGLLDPDPLVRGMDPDPDPALYPDPDHSIIKPI